MLQTVSKAIDQFIDTQGKISSLLIIPLIGVIVYEVIMRYLFNAPTIWGFEATAFVYGLHFMLGLSYTENTGGHVRVDIAIARMSPKAQAIMGTVTYGLIFVPVFLCMTIWSFKFAGTSFAGRELNATSWSPPIYPFKTMMAFSFLFLLCQGISNLLKHIRVLTEKTAEKGVNK